MNKKRSNRDEIRANNVSVMMSKDERNAFTKRARECGLSNSGYARIIFKIATAYSLPEFLAMFEKEKKGV